jgi:Flp pilus assembly protein TadD
VEIARAHAAAGAYDKAAQAARQALLADNTSLDALIVLGGADLDIGQNMEAMQAFKFAAERYPHGSPKWLTALAGLSRALVAMGRWADAEMVAKTIEQSPLPAPAERHAAGSVLLQINLAERALEQLQAAERLTPRRADLQFDLGGAYAFTGEVEASERALETAISLEPAMSQAHLFLAGLKRWSDQTAHIERLTGLYERRDRHPFLKARIGFALSKELDDLGRTEAAWPVLDESNRLARDFQKWSGADESAWIDAMIEAFPRDRFEAPSPHAPWGPSPIFIVGLPRSGTTLVERILTAHSSVEAKGELPTFGLIIKAASGVAGPSPLDASVVRGAAANADWEAVADNYQAETDFLSRGAAFAIDKMPRNSDYVGPIRLAFPNARIIHVARSPMDGLFGAYRKIFNGVYGWSYDLGDLAAHYANHRRLMDHWRGCLGSGLIEVDYDALARDPEPEIHKLLDACGLEFEPQCLNPHEVSGAVSTASWLQVRRPINREGLEVWRRYERQLEPLRRDLEGRGLI